MSMESESVSAKSVNQRIGVSRIATAFRIISRFCLNRIFLEELNQLCPRITGMTLEESLESRGQSTDSFGRPFPTEQFGTPLVQRNQSQPFDLPLHFLVIWTLNPCWNLSVEGYVWLRMLEWIFFCYLSWEISCLVYASCLSEDILLFRGEYQFNIFLRTFVSSLK